jgi:hypothetical protein
MWNVQFGLAGKKVASPLEGSQVPSWPGFRNPSVRPLSLYVGAMHNPDKASKDGAVFFFGFVQDTSDTSAGFLMIFVRMCW